MSWSAGPEAVERAKAGGTQGAGGAATYSKHWPKNTKTRRPTFGRLWLHYKISFRMYPGEGCLSSSCQDFTKIGTNQKKTRKDFFGKGNT